MTLNKSDNSYTKVLVLNTSKQEEDYRKRLMETKKVTVILKYGKRPEVLFEGFWSGKFVRAALDAIGRAYRLRRHTLKKPEIVSKENGEEVKQIIREDKANEKVKVS